jgi:hypothetical protein
MTLTVQASDSSNSVNESTPLITFNERLNETMTYITNHDYQELLKESVRTSEVTKYQNLSEMSYSETVASFKKELNKSSRNRRRWDTITSKRTNDYPFLLQQQKEIKSLKDEINIRNQMTYFLAFALAASTATNLYFAYNCNSTQK